MKEKILAIDTDPFTLSIIKQVMESAGYKVLIALDGESGLQQFYNCQPALIILDVMLPYIDGWEVCRRIRNVSNVPIIVHTALESPEHMYRAIRAGTNDYVVKPVVPEMLQLRMETILKSRRTHGEQLWPAWLSSLAAPVLEFVDHI